MNNQFVVASLFVRASHLFLYHEPFGREYLRPHFNRQDSLLPQPILRATRQKMLNNELVNSALHAILYLGRVDGLHWSNGRVGFVIVDTLAGVLVLPAVEELGGVIAVDGVVAELA